jgi:abortive infection bacteriophage resistance protein
MLCPQTEKLILDGIDLPSFVFKNWLHLFSYVRNISAHHSRLWNRQFVIKAKIPKHKIEFKGLINDKYYTFAVMTHYVLSAINDTFDFKEELKSLFAKYPNIDKKAMGFVDDWERLEMWR